MIKTLEDELSEELLDEYDQADHIDKYRYRLGLIDALLTNPNIHKYRSSRAKRLTQINHALESHEFIDYSLDEMWGVRYQLYIHNTALLLEPEGIPIPTFEVWKQYQVEIAKRAVCEAGLIH